MARSNVTRHDEKQHIENILRLSNVLDKTRPCVQTFESAANRQLSKALVKRQFVKRQSRIRTIEKENRRLLGSLLEIAQKPSICLKSAGCGLGVNSMKRATDRSRDRHVDSYVKYSKSQFNGTPSFKRNEDLSNVDELLELLNEESPRLDPQFQDLDEDSSIDNNNIPNSQADLEELSRAAEHIGKCKEPESVEQFEVELLTDVIKKLDSCLVLADRQS